MTHGRVLAETPTLARWVFWVVPLLLLGALGANHLTRIDHAGPFDPEDLGLLVLQPEEGPGSATHLGMGDGFFLPKVRVRADAAVSSVFSSVEFDGVPPHPWVVYEPGITYVVSSATWFDSEDEAADYLGRVRRSLWWMADERQRAPDGSWIVFHPAYEYAEGSGRPVPVAAAGWANSNVGLVVAYLGAESAEDVLPLAERLQERILDDWNEPKGTGP